MLQRAERTLSTRRTGDVTTTESEAAGAGAVGDVFSEVKQRAEDAILVTSSTTDDHDNDATRGTLPPPPPQKLANNVADVSAEDVAAHYGTNPTITSTALAHSLWSYVLRPGIDTAIDATAGNGSDAVVLARLLFSGNQQESTTTKSHLLCVDVQEEACRKTQSRLAKTLPASVLQNNVQVLHTSHAPLPLPPDTSFVALVVYNLGFLPNGSRNNSVITQTETTLASLADATLLLRLGGMLSVMTYPRTNAQEAAVVRAFLEGLALFSSNTHSFETYVTELDGANDYLDEERREELLVALRRVRYESGSAEPTWRVHEHRKLGWVDAPILLTATRIK